MATLAKAPSTSAEIRGDIRKEDGASYIMAPPDADKINLSGSGGSFQITKNSSGELSLIECEFVAESIFSARCMFQQAVLPVLDHLSYMNHCPILIEKISFNDTKNACQTVDYIGPYNITAIKKDITLLHDSMRPIYSLYREALNSMSNFYKFLCYYKILEGLLGKLRSDFVKAAKAVGMVPKAPKQLVPDHPETQADLRAHVGKPLKAFFDEVLTPEFRNAVAHFGTTEDGVMNMSDPLHLARYAGMIHIAELCVRLAIADHETLLASIGQASGSTTRA
jgi:hypothetical protein